MHHHAAALPLASIVIALTASAVGCAGTSSSSSSTSSSSSQAGEPAGGGGGGQSVAVPEITNEPHIAMRDGGLAPPERPEACAVIRANVDRVTAHASEHERLFASNRDRLEVFGRCRRTEHGAWAVVLEQIEPVVLDLGATSRLQGRWSLVHTDAEGEHRVARSPALPSVGRDAGDDPVNFVAGHPTTMRIHEPVFFDYDGAGEPEVVVVADETTVEYGTTTRGRVWALHGAAIEPYAPAREIVVVDTRDGDNDGRPDLVTFGPYVGEWGDYCTRHATAVAGPRLLAHSLRNGSFSLDDEAAINAAREACPSDPDPIVVTGDGGAVDNARTALNVACARLRGVPTARVVAAVQRGCRAGRRAARGRACVSGCNDVGMLVRWANAHPPLRVR